MPDLDALLNFFYIVAFLAAMILPSFQRQRREEARKRAEAQRQAQEVPTVEERSPEDVPEPTIRRAAAREDGEFGAEELPAEAPKLDAPPATPLLGSEARPGATLDPAAGAASAVGASDLTDLDEAIDLTALDEEIDVTTLDDGEESVERPKVATEARSSSEAALRFAVTDRAALQQALIFAELLRPPVTLRRDRSFPPQL